MTELGQATGERSRQEEDAITTTTSDRLSHLPDSIIHQILSLLDDTKSAVQTCSPVSLRNPVIDALKISYADEECYERRNRKLLARVIQYAASHGTQHLAIDVSKLPITLDIPDESFRFSQFFAPILNSNFKTLEFKGYVVLDSGMGSPGFHNVTTLELDGCLLGYDAIQEWDPDPFSNFPCLENLVLTDCNYGSIFDNGKMSLRISGLSLLSLKLVAMTDYSCKIEVFAPKLKFFGLCGWGLYKGFNGISLPSLEHAYVNVYGLDSKKLGRKELVERDLIPLFRSLSNAKSLTLHSRTILMLSEFYELLEQPSPLKRLKSLIVDGDSIPRKLIDYFLKGDMKTGDHPGLSIRRS
ncbi:unnamed protein product [Linum tenue]|uniref:Uncharacterized protein n=1 Tax=Linum tenue TaxID=586396 RepID=A0AAV0JGC0_9ROSI|nr:unnamed protein product [Linum tenue]